MTRTRIFIVHELDELTQALQETGVRKFVTSFTELQDAIRQKREQLRVKA